MRSTSCYLTYISYYHYTINYIWLSYIVKIVYDSNLESLLLPQGLHVYTHSAEKKILSFTVLT